MNNSHDGRKIVEDKPQMRSMQIRAAPVPMIPRAAPVAKQAPVMARSAPRTKGVSSSTTAWNTVPLAPLPPIYCLERTHLQVNDSADTVSERISDCLQKESIAATYHAQENLVDAETADGIQFSIRLWEGKNDTVLVEVQKVSGCCYSYCQAAKAVLRAAKGIRAPPTKRRTFSIPPSVPRCSPEESRESARAGLEVAENLWQRQQLDSQLLALESLVHLSKGVENQNDTARCILCGEFRTHLLVMVNSMEATSMNTNDVEKEYTTMMRRHALTILANCFGALERSGELVDLLQEQSDLRSSNLIAALVDEVAAAEERPHDAVQAVLCLKNLLAASSELKFQAAELNAFEAVSQARLGAACRHAALEDACTQLRTLL